VKAKQVLTIKNQLITKCYTGRRLQNEDLHNLYTSPNIIMVTKSKMRWVGHASFLYLGLFAVIGIHEYSLGWKMNNSKLIMFVCLFTH
jgi:hypothetical protein